MNEVSKWLSLCEMKVEDTEKQNYNFVYITKLLINLIFLDVKEENSFCLCINIGVRSSLRSLTCNLSYYPLSERTVRYRKTW